MVEFEIFLQKVFKFFKFIMIFLLNISALGPFSDNQVVHSVHGIMFKDLKQILRKEQCDASILLTANVPSAKKIIVHGPQDPDAGGIPSQFPVQEDTQFCQILRESLDFFGIEESNHKEYFLVDYKTREFYFKHS